jgi:hypothetical protein
MGGLARSVTTCRPARHSTASYSSTSRAAGTRRGRLGSGWNLLVVMMHGSGPCRLQLYRAGVCLLERVSEAMSPSSCNVSKFSQSIAQPKTRGMQGPLREVICSDRSGLDSLHRARDRHDAVSIGPRVLALPERLDPSPRPAGPDRGQQKQLRSTVSFVPFYHVGNNPYHQDKKLQSCTSPQMRFLCTTLD